MRNELKSFEFYMEKYYDSLQMYSGEVGRSPLCPFVRRHLPDGFAIKFYRYLVEEKILDNPHNSIHWRHFEDMDNEPSAIFRFMVLMDFLVKNGVREGEDGQNEIHNL